MVRIHMGNVIPFDGTVVEGEAMVNQASLTGESVAVRKIENGEVYAGTVVEEGELTIRVREANGSSKFEKIVTMIEESEKLKSGLESKAEHLADKLVPYTLAGTGLTYLLTRNVTKALAVLMVDFFVRTEIGHADFRIVCNPRGKQLQRHSQRWKNIWKQWQKQTPSYLTRQEH